MLSPVFTCLEYSINGIIDIQDLLLIVSTWGEAGIGDINNNGIVDVQDLLLVIYSWGECWPVQAPFNTPAFRSMPSGRIPLSRD